MRGSGPVRWGDEVVSCYFTVGGGVTRVRLSADEADRFDLVEGMRVRLTLPGEGPADVLVVGLRREPPFAWAELAPLGTAARPVMPLERMTSASTVGLPRESRISRACTSVMVIMLGGRPARGGKTDWKRAGT